MNFSLASNKRHCMESEEKENRNEKIDNHAKKMKATTDDQSVIRDQIIEEFRKRSLEASFQMISKNFDDYFSYRSSCLFFHCGIRNVNVLHRVETSKSNRNDNEHRKELYICLFQYFDLRHVRDLGQIYFYPDLINQLIRCRFSSGIRTDSKVKTFKNGKLIDVSEENKRYVKWKDFCKQIH